MKFEDNTDNGILLELEGDVWVIDVKDGKIVERTALDRNLVLEILSYAVRDGVEHLLEDLRRKDEEF